MSENNERQLQEYEFVLEGITTRMQLAIEKMAESNRMMSESNRRLCHTMIIVVIVMALAFLVNNVIMINHVNNIRSEVVTDAGAGSTQAVSEPGSRASD